MQVSLNLNNYNNCKKPYNAAFTSVVPVKVYGWIKTPAENVEKLYPATIPENVKSVLYSFSRVLSKGKRESGTLASDLLKIVKENIHDYNNTSKVDMRTFVNNVRGYIFTGKEAELLEDAGKKLGPAKQYGRIFYGTPSTSEVKFLSGNYRNTAYNLIRNGFKRLWKNSEPQEMHIFVHPEEKTIKGKKVTHFIIENISFVKDGKNEPLIKREIKSKIKSANPKPVENKKQAIQLELPFDNK
jgi:hypothetical protein